MIRSSGKKLAIFTVAALLFLFMTGSCTRYYIDPDVPNGEAVTVSAPQEDLWFVSVDGKSLISGGASFSALPYPKWVGVNASRHKFVLYHIPGGKRPMKPIISEALIFTLQAEHSYTARYAKKNDAFFFWIEDDASGETVAGTKPN